MTVAYSPAICWQPTSVCAADLAERVTPLAIYALKLRALICVALTTRLEGIAFSVSRQPSDAGVSTRQQSLLQS